MTSGRNVTVLIFFLSLGITYGKNVGVLKKVSQAAPFTTGNELSSRNGSLCPPEQYEEEGVCKPCKDHYDTCYNIPGECCESQNTVCSVVSPDFSFCDCEDDEAIWWDIDLEVCYYSFFHESYFVFVAIGFGMGCAIMLSCLCTVLQRMARKKALENQAAQMANLTINAQQMSSIESGPFPSIPPTSNPPIYAPTSPPVYSQQHPQPTTFSTYESAPVAPSYNTAASQVPQFDYQPTKMERSCILM